MLSAGAAFADDWNRDGVDDGYQYQQAGVRGCGPRPAYAPQGQTFSQGRYELQTVQTWVPGTQQQVYVPGQCSGRGHGHHGRGRWQQRCTPGYYQTVATAGRYVTQQQWVWVASYAPPPPPPRHDRRVAFGLGGVGAQWSGPHGAVSVSVY